MKAIFLDIDGVLNSEVFYQRDDIKKWRDELPYPISEIDPITVQRVNEIVKATNAKIVVSSSWRIGSEDEIKRIFKIVGLPTDIDFTPVISNVYRGVEIKEYLKKHPEIDNYVILDDDADMLDYQMKHFIHCQGYYGLSEKDKESAIEILNK